MIKTTIILLLLGCFAIYSKGQPISNDTLVCFVDTTDCVFRIFSQHLNPNDIEAYESRYKEDRKEIPFSTIDKIKNDANDVRFECYSNKMIGLEYIKSYSDGRLRACGFKISNGKVGNWKYYSATGVLDSIVNHSSHWGMTFCNFFELARSFGMIGKNSKMPNRKRFFEIADSLGLKSDNPNITFSNPNWVNYDFYPIQEEEENGRFSCKITFSNGSVYREWTVGKFFRIGDKSLCFYLTVLPETKDVKIYECWTAQ